MVSSNDFKTGMTIVYNGNLYSVVEFMHVKSANSMAFVRTKLRNLRTGTYTEYAFNAGEKIERAMIEKLKMQYLYNTGEHCVFMNQDTYEQIEILKDNIQNELNYMVEGMTVEVTSYNEEILGVSLPDKVTLKVTQCDPAVKGDTKTNALKDATVETGLMVKVPMFIEEGESIIVSTDTGKYASRA